MAVDSFVLGHGEAQKGRAPVLPVFGPLSVLVLCKPSNSMEVSYVGERQSKSITSIHREKIQLNQQTLPHQHKLVGEAKAQRHPLPPCTCPYASPDTTYTHIRIALVQARSEDINIGLRHLVPNEQAADCTDSVEATSRMRRCHDANPSIQDIPHKRSH